ncbi:hypothetical protein BS47DRAFT_1337905 [Hydnum rufescens UP504]|uniref:Uncharacterized protein n=1 Tax=Hydnum rufescens UP504 TaxID=1448309 RepID=A0A9P6B6R5_9AGAM|nr:hypothetical protein BS47DRAFT_1337905 [Hydnum rufescens UP504]
MPSVPFPNTPAPSSGLVNPMSQNGTSTNSRTVGNSTTDDPDAYNSGPQPSMEIGFVILGILIAIILMVIFYFNIRKWCSFRVKTHVKKAKEASPTKRISFALPPRNPAVSGLTRIPPRSSSRHPHKVSPLDPIALPTYPSHPEPSDPAPQAPPALAQSMPVDSSPFAPVLRDLSLVELQEHYDIARERISAWRQALPVDDCRQLAHSPTTTQSSQDTVVVTDSQTGLKSQETRMMTDTPSVPDSSSGAQRSSSRASSRWFTFILPGPSTPSLEDPHPTKFNT